MPRFSSTWRRRNGTTFNLTTPEAGDGGYIYIGAMSLNEYDPTNPLEGSIIDNADISYMSSIQIQGGGIVDTGATPAPDYPNDRFDNLAGNAGPASQFNAAFAFTIDDSNLSNFSNAAVFVHPDFLDELDRTIVAGGTISPFPVRGSLVGEPVDLYMYNDTVSNSAIGVEDNPSPGDNSTGNTPYEAVLLNNTFFDDAFGIQTNTTQFNGQNSNAIVNVEAMNNIFDGSSQDAVNMNGQAGDSQLQYNLFYNNIANLLITTTDGDFLGNIGATYGNPDFVGPVGSGDASAQNFELEPTSPAINAARSEIGPNAGANAVYPTVNLALSGGVLTLTRTDPNTLTNPEEPGRIGEFAFAVTDPRQILTLPGSGYFSFPDEWAPIVTGGYSSASAGNFGSTGTYNYAPVTGQRDILGYIRAPQAGSTGTGYGSNPFIDIGAYQYVNLNPPEVTGVTETPTQGATPVNFYSVGGISGVNQTPWTINITFNGPISPSTLNANTVQLVNLGSNPSQPLNEDINLSGKISYVTLDRHAGHQPGRSGSDTRNRRLSDHPVRQRIAGHHQPAGRGTRR